VTLIAGILAGAAATWWMRGIARRFGWMAAPNPIVPQHRVPTAHLGGLGIALGSAAALAAVRAPIPVRALAPLAPAVGYLSLGLADDLRPLRAGPKLVSQVVLAVLAVALGLTARVTGNAILDRAIALLWIVWVVNAVNVTDVCDGLAGGLAAVGLFYVGAIAPSERPVAWAVAGACAGFVVFNRPPASIFMGDAGSLFLGFLLAALPLRILDQVAPWPGVGMVLAAPATFVFEAVFLIAVRTRRGLRFWSGSPDHFSLRMQAAGMSKWRTDLLAWSGAAAVCATAACLPGWPTAGRAAFALIVPGAAWIFAGWLLRHEVTPSPGSDRAQDGVAIAAPAGKSGRPSA